MSHKITLGLESLLKNMSLQKEVKGNVAYLCHAASLTHDLTHGLIPLKKLLGKKLTKVFGPQHGFICDVQDNMVESNHFHHPYFDLPIFSLYSETRRPTDEMLKDIDTVIVDLQDVGTRVYTYIWTLTLTMQACAEKGIRVVILDRPNPIDGNTIEGNILDPNFSSFVGLHPIPQRHGLTIAEFALLTNRYFQKPCDLKVIPMENWKREFYFSEIDLHWVNPSPNLPTPESALTFPGTVLFEGTNISEGRGTTRSLEQIGHPEISPYQFYEEISEDLKNTNLEGFILRPINFMPTFQKFQGLTCGGFHIHITNPKAFRSWSLGQFLCQKLYHKLGADFQWQKKPYEYEFEKLAIDLINGTDKVRNWVENNDDLEKLQEIERVGLKDYLEKRETILLY